MGLIGFWPLNGDLKDYSGNGNNAVNSGAEINNSGKIGKCYSFNGLSSYIRMKNVLKLGDSFSISFWCKLSRTNGNCFFCTRTATGYGVSIFALSNNVLRFDTGTVSKYLWTTSYFIPLNEWVHITLIKDNKTDTKQLYVNGVFHSSISGAGDMLTLGANIICGASSTNTDVGIGDSNWLGGYLNDLRIYDHALSEKEVYEISKAKILHYKFDTMVEPTKNLSNGILSIYNNYGVPATLVPTGEKLNDQQVYRLTMTVDDAHSSFLDDFKTRLHSHGVFTSTRYIFKANTKYAASIYWKTVNKSDIVFGGTASNVNGWTALDGDSKIGEWNRFTAIRDGSVAEDKSDMVFFSFYCPSLVLNEAVSVDVCCPQLEEGKDYSTEYTSGIRKDNIVTDCSGYRNDAILDIVNTPRWVDNSKIGIGAYKFDGAQYIPMINPFKDGNTVSQLTLVGWMKKTADNTSGNHLISLCSNRFIRLAMDKSGKAIWMYFHYYNGTTYANFDLLYGSYTDMIMNKWYHIAATFNEGIIKIYIDGNLVKTQDESSRTTSLYSKSNDGYIGSSQGYSEYANGIIDDIRIYATALSDEDILNLYKNVASVDSDGNLYVENLTQLETEPNKMSLTNTGILKSNNISEVGITNGLMGWWPLNGNLKDISGYNQKSTNKGAEIINSDRGLVYRIDKLKYANLGINMKDFINTYGGFTLSIFINNLTIYEGYSHGVVFGALGLNWGILVYDDSKVAMGMWADVDGTRTFYRTSSNIEKNKWYHIIGSYDQLSGVIKLYVNGELKDQKIMQNPAYIYYPAPRGLLAFGSAHGEGKWSSVTMISDARLYNRALTDEEALVLYEMSAKINKIKITNDCIYTAGQFKEV